MVKRGCMVKANSRDTRSNVVVLGSPEFQPCHVEATDIRAEPTEDGSIVQHQQGRITRLLVNAPGYRPGLAVIVAHPHRHVAARPTMKLTRPLVDSRVGEQNTTRPVVLWVRITHQRRVTPVLDQCLVHPKLGERLSAVPADAPGTVTHRPGIVVAVDHIYGAI